MCAIWYANPSKMLTSDDFCNRWRLKQHSTSNGLSNIAYLDWMPCKSKSKCSACANAEQIVLGQKSWLPFAMVMAETADTTVTSLVFVGLFCKRRSFRRKRIVQSIVSRLRVQFYMTNTIAIRPQTQAMISTKIIPFLPTIISAL